MRNGVVNYRHTAYLAQFALHFAHYSLPLHFYLTVNCTSFHPGSGAEPSSSAQASPPSALGARPAPPACRWAFPACSTAQLAYSMALSLGLGLIMRVSIPSRMVLSSSKSPVSMGTSSGPLSSACSVAVSASSARPATRVSPGSGSAGAATTLTSAEGLGVGAGSVLGALSSGHAALRCPYLLHSWQRGRFLLCLVGCWSFSLVLELGCRLAGCLVSLPAGFLGAGCPFSTLMVNVKLPGSPLGTGAIENWGV